MIRNTFRITGSLIVALVMIAVSGVGCSDSTSPDDTQKVTVTLREYTITMSPSTLHSGKTVFTVTNAGAEDHNFEVEEEATDAEFEFPVPLRPGETKDLTVTLNKGEYEMYDPVSDNKAKGMVVHVDVE